MGHGLTSTDTMYSVRETPWHGLGAVLPNAPTMEEAIVLAGQQFTVESGPVFERCADGSYREVEGYQSLTRSDNGGNLSIMRSTYGVVQNTNAHAAIAEFLRQGGVSNETGGTLHGGRTAWWLLRVGDGIVIPGDDSRVEQFLLFSWSHDGTRRFTVQFVKVRVVCQNTLTMAQHGATISFSTKHTRRASDRVDAYAATIAAAADELAEFSEMAAAFAAAPFGREEWRLAADTLYPLPLDGEGKVLTDGIRVERAFAAQDAFLALRGGPTVSGAMAENAWGALNAAVEMSDWLLGVEVNPDKRNLDAESQFIRTIGGGRDDDKVHALSVIAGIAGVKVPA